VIARGLLFAALAGSILIGDLAPNLNAAPAPPFRQSPMQRRGHDGHAIDSWSGAAGPQHASASRRIAFGAS
jgi:hypothetical protein